MDGEGGIGMNFVHTTIVLGFSFTVGVLLCLSFMCLTGMIINSLFCKIQARLLARKVEKEIGRFNKEIKRKEKENERA